MSSTRTTTPDTTPDRGFFGHPRPLANLFGVEMWERFSFYGMQGILLIYLYYSAAEGGLGISEATATQIVGAYGGGVYLATIVGAWLADRVLGPERTLFYAAVVVMLGHIALSTIPGTTGVAVGLVLIALGSGGVKANASSLVGSLYAADDDRRDGGFSLFYMGINLGAFVGPLLTGLLQEDWGFHYGFALAAVGMAAGLVQYSIGRRRLPDVGAGGGDTYGAGRGAAGSAGVTDVTAGPGCGGSALLGWPGPSTTWPAGSIGPSHPGG